MGDLAAFREQIQKYLKMHEKTQRDLADALFMGRTHVNKILNDKEPMPADFVYRAVIALAAIKCIRGKDQARMLLGLMDAPDFPVADWAIKPLAGLPVMRSKKLSLLA